MVKKSAGIIIVHVQRNMSTIKDEVALYQNLKISREYIYIRIKYRVSKQNKETFKKGMWLEKYLK